MKKPPPARRSRGNGRGIRLDLRFPRSSGLPVLETTEWIERFRFPVGASIRAPSGLARPSRAARPPGAR
jgi:hypothetical protein